MKLSRVLQIRSELELNCSDMNWVVNTVNELIESVKPVPDMTFCYSPKCLTMVTMPEDYEEERYSNGEVVNPLLCDKCKEGEEHAKTT